jgi:hypothetical protein
VEARSQGRVGEHLEEVNARRGSVQQTPGNAGLLGTDSLDAQTPVAEIGGRRPGRLRTRSIRRHEGQATPRGGLATREGKPLKAEAQGRYRHETRPDRLRAEQCAEGWRKPEGAA